jgi:hypothetical protein
VHSTETTAAAAPRGDRGAATSGGVQLVALGALCGLAWAAGLRGFMAQVAGQDSQVDWTGTFAWILAPGIATGALFALAEHWHHIGGHRYRRWLALSPLCFAAIFLSDPLHIGAFFATGIGGGAIGVPLMAMAGAYALSQRGPLWTRLACAAVALISIPVWALTAADIGGPDLALTTARGAWVAVYFWSFLAVLTVGCCIPHRGAPKT